MPVRVSKAHDSLPPSVLVGWVNELKFLARSRQKSVEILLFEIDFSVVSAERNLFSDEICPGIERLQADAAGKCDIRPEIRDDAKPENFTIKSLGNIQVFYRKQRIPKFHFLLLFFL